MKDSVWLVQQEPIVLAQARLNVLNVDVVRKQMPLEQLVSSVRLERFQRNMETVKIVLLERLLLDRELVNVFLVE